MLNNKPSSNGKYHQGNYIPKNKDKVIKLNNFGGLFYRSSWEKKIMVWLDMNEKILRWSAEGIKIPYQISKVNNGLVSLETHTYYPDFYYEMENQDGELRKIVVEVKPKSEYNDVLLFESGKFDVSNATTIKKLKNIEYRFKMAQKNSEKWKTMIRWCEKKGYEFIIITEDSLKKFNV
jgi:hypothetical protein